MAQTWPHKYSRDTKEQIRQLLLKGHRVIDVAPQFGVVPTTISRWNMVWGIKIRQGVSRGPVCPHCNEEKPNYRSGKCQQCYNKSRLRPGGLRRGPTHHWWKGGHTTDIARFTLGYRLWRRAVYKRDDFTCQECGQRGGRLHAHHLIPQSARPDLRLELSNGQTLCIPCHRKTPTWGEGAKKYRKTHTIVRCTIQAALLSSPYPRSLAVSYMWSGQAAPRSPHRVQKPTR